MIESAEVRSIEQVEIAAFRARLAKGDAFAMHVSDESHNECYWLCIADRRLPNTCNAVWWGGNGVEYRVPARRTDGEWAR